MIDFKKTIWKKLAADKKITAVHFLQRAILTAVRSKSNSPKEDIMYSLLAKYFTPITNKNKLANGQDLELKIIQLKRKAMSRSVTTILDAPAPDIFEDTEEEKQYYTMLENLDYKRVKRKQYVYYFTVQEGLTPEQQGVQAGHVLFALGVSLRNKNLDPHAIYFQWIGVKDTVDLMKIADKHSRIQHVKFSEPDMGNIITSVAFHPVFADKRREFLDYDLLVH